MASICKLFVTRGGWLDRTKTSIPASRPWHNRCCRFQNLRSRKTSICVLCICASSTNQPFMTHFKWPEKELFPARHEAPLHEYRRHVSVISQIDEFLEYVFSGIVSQAHRHNRPPFFSLLQRIKENSVKALAFIEAAQRGRSPHRPGSAKCRKKKAATKSSLLSLLLLLAEI